MYMYLFYHKPIGMKNILQFALPLILIVFGIQLTRDYFGATGSERRAELEQLIAAGAETPGVLADEYTEKTTKVRRARIKTYEVTYKYEVDGKQYSGTKTLQSPPTIPVVVVTYLADNPRLSAIDPAEELSSLTSSEGDTFTLLAGLGLALAGAGLGYFRYRKSIGQVSAV